MSGDKIKQRTATAVSVAAVAVYTALENKLQIGICGDIFNYGSPAGDRPGEAETEGLQNGFAHFLSTVLFLNVFVVVGDSTTL